MIRNRHILEAYERDLRRRSPNDIARNLRILDGLGMFEEHLAKLARALVARKLPYMLIGGQAVLVHGEPRLTRDMDVTSPRISLGRIFPGAGNTPVRNL